MSKRLGGGKRKLGGKESLSLPRPDGYRLGGPGLIFSEMEKGTKEEKISFQRPHFFYDRNDEGKWGIFFLRRKERKGKKSEGEKENIHDLIGRYRTDFSCPCSPFDF